MSSSTPASSGPGPFDQLQPDQLELLEELVDLVERPRLEISESELLGDPTHYKKSTLPRGKLPGFGEPDENCGEPIVEAMHYCDSCYDVKELPHNCYGYDCPDHGLNAVRRRAAGNKSMPGVAPFLGALRAVLDARRGEHQVFQHFTLSPPSDFFWNSDQPLERGFQLCREVMDLFDAQGIVVYHPWRGPRSDDRGYWKSILGHGLEWSEVREELRYGPHFHIVGVAPNGGVPGGQVTRALEAETGWILDRHTSRDSNVSVYDDEAMARAVTYTLSHGLVYETDEGKRKLAARRKGPDVNEIEVYTDWKKQHQANVYDAAETTLGISAPDMECIGSSLRPSPQRRSNSHEAATRLRSS